jgi:transcription termination factor NusB
MSETDATNPGTRHRTRHRAREAAVQILYQSEVGQSDIEEVLRTFWSANLPGSEGASESVRAFAEQLVRVTAANLDRVDPIIVETAEHWRLSRMAALRVTSSSTKRSSWQRRSAARNR